MKAIVSLSRRSIGVGIASGMLTVICAACVTPPSATLVAPTVVTLAPNTPTASPSPIASPTTSVVLRTVPFEVIAEGAPFVGKGRVPILLAIRGDDPKRAVPDDLPEQAKETLQRIFGTPTPDLYIVIYTGLGGHGFRVRINSIIVRQDPGIEHLVINYSVEKPLPSTPQPDVITHPFVIVRVSNTTLRASDVVFEGPTAPSPVASPTAPAVIRTVPFEVITEGAPFVGKGHAPILLAIRGDDPKRVVPDDLPQMAKEALQKALAQPAPDLYIVVYAGVRSSSGYQMRINSITIRREAARDWLVVNYSEVKPPVGQGGATVLTHPFVIMRVSNSNVRASDVVFESQ